MMIRSSDVDDVLNVVHAYFSSADAREWATYRSLHTERIEVDFGGVNDGSAGSVLADDMVSSARGLLDPVALTQHMITNEIVDVDGDEALVRFYEQALHHSPALGEDPAVSTWVLFARGEHRLVRTADGWRLAGARLRPVHSTGNAAFLEDVARAVTRDSAQTTA